MTVQATVSVTVVAKGSVSVVATGMVNAVVVGTVSAAMATSMETGAGVVAIREEYVLPATVVSGFCYCRWTAAVRD